MFPALVNVRDFESPARQLHTLRDYHSTISMDLQFARLTMVDLRSLKPIPPWSHNLRGPTSPYRTASNTALATRYAISEFCTD